jgi:hypothetical protein
MILYDRRITAKRISETFEISQERVGYIIHENLDMRKLSAKWVPKCLNAVQKRNRVLLHKSFWADLDGILWDS